MAELALAIVPIFFGAVRGFSIIREKTHLLRHYHKEIRRLRDKVEVQSRCFRGEVYHLIIDTLDDHTAQLLIRDDDHAYWKSQDLEGTLSRHLGELRLDFRKAIDEVKTALTHIETRLSVFAEPDVTSPLFQATKDRFRLMFKKEEYKEDIKLVKEWVAELKRIRKLAHKIRKSSITKTKEKSQEKELLESDRSEEPDLGAVKYFRTIRHLSSGLQSLMQRQWSCSNMSHSCHASRLLIGSIWQRSSVLWLFEASGRQGSATLSNRLLFNVASEQLGLLTPESFDRRSFDDYDAPSPKRQRVSSQSHLLTNEQPEFAAAPLDDVQTLCQQLEACVLSPHTRAFSHIDPQVRERFKFESKEIGDWHSHRMSCAADLLSQSIDRVLNRERVQMALALVRGALVNHSTSAWPQGCVLEGISYLQDPHTGVDVTAALSTLNIQVQVGRADAMDMDMEGGSIISEEELQFTYGIQNQILYRLGVALLSIGLWAKIDWTDIAAVRRKAAALDSLGEKYREVVKRLIWGNFGVDTTDLGDERLQAEILRTVINPLERRAVPRRRGQVDSVKLGGGVWNDGALRELSVR